MSRIIRNSWHRLVDRPYEMAHILQKNIHPEGLDVVIIKFNKPGQYFFDKNAGHFCSAVAGDAALHVSDLKKKLSLKTGVHLYIPPGLDTCVEAKPNTMFIQVSALTPEQVSGKKLLLRDETFLRACALGEQSLRWILTPQYLSRRIFLHHDKTLLSKSGDPVSWFHTSMFDVRGLPENEDGEPVFKMSYNSKTEFNICYEVTGKAKVRMAKHPYRNANQQWEPWINLDENSTYLLHEIYGGPEEEIVFEKDTESLVRLRNKHEVSIYDGHVSLFCLFDPAPTGIEQHTPGEYSDYEPLLNILGTSKHNEYLDKIVDFDVMVDTLSVAKAEGKLEALFGSNIWDLYIRGKESQQNIENGLMQIFNTDSSNHPRVDILRRWSPQSL